MSPRTLTIFLPDAEVQYWFTDRVFVVGEHLKRDGVTWIVTNVSASDGGGKHTSITVCRDGDAPPSERGLAVTETRVFNVSLALKDPLRAVDPFYKYRGEHLPAEGEIIEVVRFIRGRVIRAR